jgi:hypothetical protein
VLLWALCGGALAATVTCPQSALRVAADAPRDAELACQGASRAVGFLSGLGLAAPPGLLIEVVDALPELYGTGQLGSFHARSGRVQVLGYAQCREILRNYPLFGLDLDEDLYRSIVAHEVAHAFAATNYSGRGTAIVAQEYLAYVTQFIALPPALRQRILEASDIRAFAHDSSISETFYFLDPHAFAIAAFGHFAAHKDGPGFIRRLLRGEVRTAPRR